ncbi:MAG: L-threonylcarbamoyladenylate synthase [Myxococcota bacterium]|nr:L-threonylcarbamoyladenylate synthase [Myxococcota bacterium]
MRPVEEAARILRSGGLVAFPTETVYGLGADASSDEAVRRIFAAKGRPADHPLIVHVASAPEHWAARWSPEAAALAAAFWPGPLTLIVPKAAHVSDVVTGGEPTVGIRVPDHPVAQALLAAFAGGVAAPSANRFGQVSPTTAAHVAIELADRVDLILDGGACAVGVESSIVDLSGDAPRLLRPGGVSLEALEEALGAPLASGGSTRAPGTLPSHYAPRARVLAVARGDVERTVEREAATGARVRELRLPADPAAAARALYAALRELDEEGVDVAVVALPEERGLGRAVADRLRRASAPRPG